MLFLNSFNAASIIILLAGLISIAANPVPKDGNLPPVCNPYDLNASGGISKLSQTNNGELTKVWQSADIYTFIDKAAQISLFAVMTNPIKITSLEEKGNKAYVVGISFVENGNSPYFFRINQSHECYFTTPGIQGYNEAILKWKPSKVVYYELV